MSKIEIDEKNAKELSEQIARELYEIHRRKLKEMQDETDTKLDDLGLRGSPYGPSIPEIDMDEQRTAEDLEYALEEGESDRFEVKKRKK